MALAAQQRVKGVVLGPPLESKYSKKTYGIVGSYGPRRFERNRELPRSYTVFVMDPPDNPHGSQVGEPQNGPAAEEEPVHSNQDSSQFKTIGTVISRRGTQSGLAHFLSSTTHKDLSSTSSMIKFIVVLSIFLQIFLSYTSASCTTSSMLLGTNTRGRCKGMKTTTKMIGLSCIDQETHGGQMWSTGWPANTF